MKRILSFMSVFLIMLVYCSVPLKTKAEYNNMETTATSFVNHYKSDFLDDAEKYIFFNFDITSPEVRSGCIIKFTSQDLITGSFDFTNNIVTISNGQFSFFAINTYVNTYQAHFASQIVFDFNTEIGYIMENGYKYNFNLNDEAQNFHFYNFDSNLDNFSDEYNINVSFNPILSGNVDREITVNGSKSMLSSLTMTVENHCSFNIQYDMRIYKKFQQSHRSYDALTADDTFFDDDPIFMYYKNQWVYCTNYDDMNSFLNNETVKENKPSFWHYLASGSTDTVTIDFSQLNFLEGEEYTVTVRAVRNDYGISSEQIVYLASDDPANTSLYQIQGDNIQTVYESDFVMINYNDVKYDPNNNNNGVLAYNGRNGQVARNNYQYSRNAREEQNGNIDYSSRNLYTNQNSWLNQQRSNTIINHSSYKSGSIPASLSNHFNSFLTFITSIFSKLPLDIQHIYIYGFVSVVVLGIILKVIK